MPTSRPSPPSNMESLEPFVPLGLLFSRTTSQNRRFRFTFPPISLASSSICSSAPSRCSNFKHRLLGGVWWQWGNQQSFEGCPKIEYSSPGVLRPFGLGRVSERTVCDPFFKDATVGYVVTWLRSFTNGSCSVTMQPCLVNWLQLRLRPVTKVSYRNQVSYRNRMGLRGNGN